MYATHNVMATTVFRRIMLQILALGIIDEFHKYRMIEMKKGPLNLAINFLILTKVLPFKNFSSV